MTDILIEGGEALLGGELVETSLRIEDGDIGAAGARHGRASLGLDASGLKVLPGIIDLHGDAFERQMMPRVGVKVRPLGCPMAITSWPNRSSSSTAPPLP